jgi:hypothetical protein
MKNGECLKAEPVPLPERRYLIKPAIKHSHKIKSAKTLAHLPPRYLNAVPRQYSINQASCALMSCFKMFHVQVSSAADILNKLGIA